MEKDTRILVGAVLILFVSALAFNIDSTITGEAKAKLASKQSKCTDADWKCDSWGECNQKNQQVCKKLTKLNNCKGSTAAKSATIQKCEYLRPCILDDFKCSDWSVCTTTEDIQTRKCEKKVEIKCKETLRPKETQGCPVQVAPILFAAEEQAFLKIFVAGKELKNCFAEVGATKITCQFGGWVTSSALSSGLVETKAVSNLWPVTKLTYKYQYGSINQVSRVPTCNNQLACSSTDRLDRSITSANYIVIAEATKN